MTKRDTRRALTRLFADRDAAVTAYALAFLEKEKLRRRLAGLDDDLKELKRKAREAGARAGDLEAAEQAMIQTSTTQRRTPTAKATRPKPHRRRPTIPRPATCPRRWIRFPAIRPAWPDRSGTGPMVRPRRPVRTSRPMAVDTDGRRPEAGVPGREDPVPWIGRAADLRVGFHRARPARLPRSGFHDDHGRFRIFEEALGQGSDGIRVPGSGGGGHPRAGRLVRAGGVPARGRGRSRATAAGRFGIVRGPA